jgi:hypothetical protein
MADHAAAVVYRKPLVVFEIMPGFPVYPRLPVGMNREMRPLVLMYMIDVMIVPYIMRVIVIIDMHYRAIGEIVGIIVIPVEVHGNFPWPEIDSIIRVIVNFPVPKNPPARWIDIPAVYPVAYHKFFCITGITAISTALIFALLFTVAISFSTLRFYLLLRKRDCRHKQPD